MKVEVIEHHRVSDFKSLMKTTLSRIAVADLIDTKFSTTCDPKGNIIYSAIIIHK
ncbi:MAG: hypothetical protein ABS939_04555 [Psychrobacillus sp.]